MVLNPGIQVVLLKNHGVIVGANTVEGAHKLLSELSERLVLTPRNIDAKAALPWFNSQISALPDSGYEPCMDPYLTQLVLDCDLYHRLKDSWAICPDHVVFLGATAACVDNLADLPRYLQSLEPETPFLFMPLPEPVISYTSSNLVAVFKPSIQ
jgi:rhamnose utilization protein RhaD (predicted bifunctional aldolase and dehydrogenase)